MPSSRKIRPGADRLYSTYEVVARNKKNGVEFLGRNHQARKVDFRKGRKISPNQRLIEWVKPRQMSKGCRLSQEEWEALPAKMTIRLIRCKGPDRQGRKKVRYIVTTLLDHKEYPGEEVVSLYFQRWEIEVRLLMLKAGLCHGVNHRRLSYMWQRLAEREVIERPGRNEPRRVKRRPKCTYWLQRPRHQYFEHFRSDEPALKILDQLP